MQHSLVFALVIWLFQACLAYAELSVPDDTGRQMRLNPPAQRIITLAPHATELLFAIGAGKRIVGTVEYSDFPEDAKRIPRIGGYNGLDMEAIAVLRPDVIIAWSGGTPPAQIKKLRQLGLPLYLSAPKNVADIAGALERLGALTGEKIAAAQAAAQFRRTLDTLRSKYQGRDKVSVFYQTWNHPLVTINGEQIISDVLKLCGGENIFARLPGLAPTVSIEAVLQADPQAILTSSTDHSPPTGLDEWKRWPQLRAVRNEHLYYVSGDLISRPTPRILQGMAEVCGKLDEVRTTK